MPLDLSDVAWRPARHRSRVTRWQPRSCTEAPAQRELRLVNIECAPAQRADRRCATSRCEPGRRGPGLRQDDHPGPADSARAWRNRCACTPTRCARCEGSVPRRRRQKVRFFKLLFPRSSASSPRELVIHGPAVIQMVRVVIAHEERWRTELRWPDFEKRGRHGDFQLPDRRRPAADVGSWPDTPMAPSRRPPPGRSSMRTHDRGLSRRSAVVGGGVLCAAARCAAPSRGHRKAWPHRAIDRRHPLDAGGR